MASEAWKSSVAPVLVVIVRPTVVMLPSDVAVGLLLFTVELAITVPLEIVMLPESVLAPESVSVPPPDFVRATDPARIDDTVAVTPLLVVIVGDVPASVSVLPVTV